MNYILLIGAMKSGTTLLFSHLAQHPSISPACSKEPEFFSKNFDKGMAWYEEQFTVSPTATWRLDGSTGYTKLPLWMGVAERIKASKLEVKLIYLVRNPIDRLVSHLRHRVEHGHTKSISKWDEEALKFLPISNYHMQLLPYEAALGNDILILDYDDLIANPAKIAGLCLDYIGLPYTFSRHEDPHVVNAGDPGLKTLDFSPEDRKALYGRIRDDIREFGRKYHFDISKWEMDLT